MECISEQTVEQTWQTVADLTPDAAATEMMSMASRQPHLLGFVTAFLEELRDDAREMGTYLLFVVYKIFENSTTEEITKVQPDAIKDQYEVNQELLLDMETDADEEPTLEDFACLESTKQPWVFRYVTEALLEPDDDLPEEERISLSDEEFGEVVILLKTVIDVLDAATS